MLTKQSGNCGDVPESLVSFDPNASLGENCKRLTDDRLSEGNCKVERSIECVTEVDDPRAYGGKSALKITTIGVTRQKTADGSILEGTLSFNVSGTSDGPCSGTYGVTWTRQ